MTVIDGEAYQFACVSVTTDTSLAPCGHTHESLTTFPQLKEEAQ